MVQKMKSMVADSQFLDDLISRHRSGEALDFTFFWKAVPHLDGVLDASCFSQWYVSPFQHNGRRYLTAEHFMMAEKARLFGDEQVEEEILSAENPAMVQKLGRRVQRFDAELWNARRFEIVTRGSVLKFGSSPELRAFIESTGRSILVEASPVDRIWGIGLAEDATDATQPDRWNGLNLLGFALIIAREQLRKSNGS